MGANNKPLTDEEFKRRAKSAHPAVIFHSEYQKSHGIVNAECTDCGNFWSPKAYSIMQGHGCSVCRGGGKTWTQEQYAMRLKKVHNGKIIVIDDYVDSATHIFHRCQAGHEWKATPRTIAGGTGCPDCVQVRMIAGRYADQTKYEFTERARALTRAVYKRFSHLINPENLRRGRKDYVIDHKMSIAECYYNPKELKDPIRLEELCHPANLEMLHYKVNLSKMTKCSITASELRTAIKSWNKTYGRPFSVYGERLTFHTEDLLKGGLDFDQILLSTHHVLN